MISNFYKKHRIFFLLVFIAIFILIWQSKLSKNNPSFMETGTAVLINPVEKSFSGLSYNFKDLIYNITHFNYLARENRILRKENLRLIKENTESSFLKLENIQLKRLLALKKRTPQKVITAEIVSRFPSSWFSLITINKGKAAGVSINMVVIAPEGLVGKIIKVYPYSSLAQLITDPECVVPAQVLSDGQYLGIVYGQGDGFCIMKYLNSSAKLRLGEDVVTSATSQIFPKGVLIGKIIKILGLDEDLYKNLKIKPTVDFSKLRYVILTK